MTTPTKRFPVPECIKAIVVSNIRDNYEFLVGQFDGKAGKTRDKRAKILQEIYDKAEAKAKLEKIDKHFENRTQMWAKFIQWKNNIRKKELAEAHTGASPSSRWPESDQILWHIRHEFEGKIEKYKSAVPCTDREVTDSSSSAKSLHSMNSVVLTHKDMKQNRAESKKAAKSKKEVDFLIESPSNSPPSKKKKMSALSDSIASPSDLENSIDDPPYNSNDAEDSDSSNNSSVYQLKTKKKKHNDKKKIKRNASMHSSKSAKKFSSNELAFRRTMQAIENDEDIPLVSFINTLYLRFSYAYDLN